MIWIHPLRKNRTLIRPYKIHNYLFSSNVELLMILIPPCGKNLIWTQHLWKTLSGDNPLGKTWSGFNTCEKTVPNPTPDPDPRRVKNLIRIQQLWKTWSGSNNCEKTVPDPTLWKNGIWIRNPDVLNDEYQVEELSQSQGQPTGSDNRGVDT